jgi:glycosyltransferase involved in cell wall biosynthesis
MTAMPTRSSEPLCVAYFINQYPKVSHSFIRREILALEQQGLEIERIALRGWSDHIVDADDMRERTKTRYVLEQGLPALLFAMLHALLASPLRLVSALALAARMGWRSERPMLYHLIYVAEACRMLPWLKSAGVQHIHAHFGTNSAEIVMLANTLGGPSYSFTVHGTEVFDKPEFLGLAEKVRRAAFVVTVSSFGRGQIYRWIDHADWPKVLVVHCGLEPAFHSVAPTPPPAAPRLVCVGRLSGEKGQLLLIEACHRLAQKGLPFELVLAGDGEMRPELEALIARHGLGDRVRITGWISSDLVRDEILAARGLVLPSFAEGLPVVIMEAMALRRPVIATYVGGIPELVRPGENGWLVPAGSVDDLAMALEDFMRTPDDVLLRMADAAYERVVARHDIDTEAAKLARLYRDSAS